jgi:Fur family transcriptional regulator, ferric uptake regulator
MKKEPAIRQLLLNHNLRTTNCRQGILDILSQASEALTEHDIKEQLENHHDRTTIYRSFRTLIDNNLIHKIVVDNNLVKYALNPESYNACDHVHFYCKQCDKLVCIESEQHTGIPLPAGFNATETEIIIKGTCQTCSA